MNNKEITCKECGTKFKIDVMVVEDRICGGYSETIIDSCPRCGWCEE